MAIGYAESMDPGVGLWNAGNRFRENIPGRYGVYTDEAAALTTQVMLSIGVPLYAGDIVTNITVMVGATAGGTITNQWGALYSSAATPALMSQSADGTSAAIAASTALTFALSTNGGAQTITKDGIYWAAVMVKASQMPSLACQNTGLAVFAGAALSGQVVRAQTSGSSLTATAPATIATPTTVLKVPYVVVS